MAKRKRPTPTQAAKFHKLQERWSHCLAEKEGYRNLSEHLTKVQGANEQRIADLEERLHDAETKAHEAEVEAAHNMEELRDDLNEATRDANYNDGLADGRGEAMQILERLVAKAPKRLKALVGPSLGDMLAPIVPDINKVARDIVDAVRAIAAIKTAKSPDPSNDPDDQVGD